MISRKIYVSSKKILKNPHCSWKLFYCRKIGLLYSSWFCHWHFYGISIPYKSNIDPISIRSLAFLWPLAFRNFDKLIEVLPHVLKASHAKIWIFPPNNFQTLQQTHLARITVFRFSASENNTFGLYLEKCLEMLPFANGVF